MVRLAQEVKKGSERRGGFEGESAAKNLQSRDDIRDRYVEIWSQRFNGMPLRSTKFPLVGIFLFLILLLFQFIFEVIAGDFSTCIRNSAASNTCLYLADFEGNKIARLSMWVNESIKSFDSFNICKEEEFLDQTISYFYDCPPAHSYFSVPK